MTCYIQLPDPYAADGIDPEGVLFNGILSAEKSGITDHGGDGIGELMVKFSREAVESMLAEGDAITVTVSCTAGNVGFSGTDVIRVIRRGKDAGKKKKPALFQSAEYAGSAPAGPTGAMEIFYAHPDHLGTPRAITDANGNVVWKADYRPFGEAEVVIGDVGNEIRFPGQYYDAETGLHYNWHRYYDPETGRYLRPDPIGLDGGINLYAYVQNNPLTNIDPYGLDTWAGMSVEADVIFILYGGVSKVVGSLTNRSTGETCYYEIKCKKVGIGLMLFDVSGSGNMAFNGPKCGKDLCGTSVGAGIDIGYAAFAASVDSNGTGTLILVRINR